MFLRRTIPIFIVGFFGAFTLFGWFIENESIKAFINDDATQWYDIIASFAIFLGALNLLKLQSLKVLKRQSGWQYSLIAILSFLYVFVIGFFMRGAFFVEISSIPSNPDPMINLVNETTALELNSSYFVDVNNENPFRIEVPFYTDSSADDFVAQLASLGVNSTVVPTPWGAHIQTSGGLFKWMFDNIFTPLSATMFALLAFFVASASYRAFKARNFEATLLLLAGIIIMIGRVPVGSLISSWFVMYLTVLGVGVVLSGLVRDRRIIFGWVLFGLLFVTILGMQMGWPIDKPTMFFLPALQEWIYMVPNVAGARAIMIGIGLGIIITSLRYIFGLEKSYIGDQ